MKMLEYTEIKISDLVFNENNPRINDEAAEKLTKGIEKYGFINPVVVNRQGNMILAGHTRVKALKKLGKKTVPVLFVDMDEATARGFAIWDNKSAEFSEWDKDLLDIEIQGLIDLDFDIELTGFSLADLGLGEPEPGGLTDDDETPEPPADPVSKLGDVWLLGNHRVMCGDSTDAAQVAVLMDGKKADMVFTDPPYGMEYQSNGRTKTEKFAVLQNDNVVLDFFKSMEGFVEGFVYVCTTWKVADNWIDLFKKYYDLTNVVIWDKGGGGIGDLYKTFATDYEMMLVSHCGHEIKGRRHGSVWSFTKQEIDKMKKVDLLSLVNEMHKMKSIWCVAKDGGSSYLHPTQKPVALAARAIRSSIDFGQIALDLFLGSGSTLIACEKTNRTCYGMELSEAYTDVVCKRWMDYTGKQAIHAETGEPFPT